MNETPEDPRLPDEGGGDEEPTAETELPAEPPYEPVELPPLNPLGDLPPLDDTDTVTEKRRLLSSGRLAVAAIVVLALIGGTAFALTSGGDDSDDDGGIASVDGSEDEGDTDSNGSSGDGDLSKEELEDAMLEYAQCMRDNGIDMPDPEFTDDGGGMAIAGGPGAKDGSGPSEDEWAAADEACASIMEDVRGDMEPPSAEEIAEMQDQLIEAAQCMRDKGYDMPDPEVSSDGGMRIDIGSEGDSGGSIDFDDPQFQDDQGECNEKAGFEEGPMGKPADEAGS